MSGRKTSDPAFWDARYFLPDPPFGTAPNAFLVSEAWRIPPKSQVLDLGAGDGRNAIWLAEQGHAVTALDFSPGGLALAQSRASDLGLEIETIQADLAVWKPERRWEAIVCTFVHLVASDRAHLFQSILEALRPGGLLIAEWFSVKNLDVPGPGPSTPDRLLTREELRAALPDRAFIRCDDASPVLGEGTFIVGPAATIRVVYLHGS